MLHSVTLNAMTSALDGYAAQQRAIANNIANVNTPGYTAQEVQFADALAASVASGSCLLGLGALTPAESLEPTRLNGNNVDLASETTQQISASLKFQFASQAAQQQFSSMRAAMAV